MSFLAVFSFGPFQFGHSVSFRPEQVVGVLVLAEKGGVGSVEPGDDLVVVIAGVESMFLFEVLEEFVVDVLLFCRVVGN